MDDGRCLAVRLSQSLLAILRDVVRAARVRVDRTIVTELIISSIGDAKISANPSVAIPATTVRAKYFSTAIKRRSLRTLDRMRLSGRPR